MDSSSPSTSGSDSPNGSDARNGEGLAVDEIMRMKEKRRRLLDNYRNEQEESILPLMREADEINRKKKKKSKSQFQAENNTPLRRSERIMTQTLNEIGTLESPMDEPQLEPEPVPEPQDEPEFEPEPAPIAEPEPEPAPIAEPQPRSVPMNEYERELEPMNGCQQELEPMNGCQQELEPMNGCQQELEPMNGCQSELLPMDVSESEPGSSDESESRFGYTDEYDSDFESTDEFGIEPVSTDESDAEFEAMDGFGQQIRRGRHATVRLAPRRVFAVHPAPWRLNNPLPVINWRKFRVDGRNGNSYGQIEGFDTGYQWNTRLECSRDKIHRPSIAGIHAGPSGAYSVALSGAYPEDVDFGHVVIFTGAGGRANGRSRSVRNAPQVKDQELNKANMSLMMSMKTGNPVRLIRGHKLASFYAPEHGYRYDGLYIVDHCWYDYGCSGFRVFRFRMTRVENQTAAPWEILPRGMILPQQFTRSLFLTTSRTLLRMRRWSQCDSSLEGLDEQIEESISRFCRNPPFEFKHDDDPDQDDGVAQPPFRGWILV